MHGVGSYKVEWKAEVYNVGIYFIDFVMDQFSPEMRKEIMDHAIEDRFSEGASTSRYLVDWYTTDGERNPV